MDLGVDSVDYVFLTHIHLDHAGGAGAMMRAFPNARLVSHLRAAPVTADPDKLVAGAAAVYGANEVRRMYGEILPIDATRIIEAPMKPVSIWPGANFCASTHRAMRVTISALSIAAATRSLPVTPSGLSYRGTRHRWPSVRLPDDDTGPVRSRGDARLDRPADVLRAAAQCIFYASASCAMSSAVPMTCNRLVDTHVEIARRESRPGPDRHARIPRQCFLPD